MPIRDVLSSLVFASTLGFAVTAAGAEPSFDCTKAQSSAEQAICASEALGELDVETARLYALARGTPDLAAERLSELTAMQRGWIKGRDDCWKAEDLAQCVTQSYLVRIMDLRQGYAHARSEDDLGLSSGPVSIACTDADFGIGAVFVTGGSSYVVLRWQEDTVGLTRVESGSGALYAGPHWSGTPVEMWTKGGEAKLTLPQGAQMACVVEEIG